MSCIQVKMAGYLKSATSLGVNAINHQGRNIYDPGNVCEQCQE